VKFGDEYKSNIDQYIIIALDRQDAIINSVEWDWRLRAELQSASRIGQISIDLSRLAIGVRDAMRGHTSPLLEAGLMRATHVVDIPSDR
jgi:hypothetical protein